MISRYKKSVRLPDSMIISEEMVLKHWELEKELARRLRQSTPENRWETSEECYTTLYNELPWLNLTLSDEPSDFDMIYSDWISAIGPPPKRIYEVGSGKGSLIKYLADLGYDCTGTEITKERGRKFDSGNACLRWGITDGIHLARFEKPGTYDIVISDQVIEHLHPDDLEEHFRGAFAILRTDGSYILRTPHYCYGPDDISKIFKCTEPEGTHLKEYTYAEITTALKKSGFNEIRAILSIPYGIRKMIGVKSKPKLSSAYLRYLCTIEKCLKAIPHHPSRHMMTVLLTGLLLFKTTVFVITTKH